MLEPTEQEVTTFLEALGAGDGPALGELFSASYEEVHRLAHFQRRRWSGQETLSTTVLVHEAYLKLCQQDPTLWRDRGHFLRVVTRAMRHILINYAKRSRRLKRGGESTHVPADDVAAIEASRIEDVLVLDEALSRLARRHPRWAQVVECRAFAGLDVKETAEALDISPRTVKRDWQRGQAWLFHQLGSPPSAAATSSTTAGLGGCDEETRG